MTQLQGFLSFLLVLCFCTHVNTNKRIVDSPLLPRKKKGVDVDKLLEQSQHRVAKDEKHAAILITQIETLQELFVRNHAIIENNRLENVRHLIGKNDSFTQSLHKFVNLNSLNGTSSDCEKLIQCYNSLFPILAEGRTGLEKAVKEQVDIVLNQLQVSNIQEPTASIPVIEEVDNVS